MFSQKGGGAFGGSLVIGSFTWEDMKGKVFRKGGVLLQEGCSLTVG